MNALLITTGGDIATQVAYCLRAMRCRISLLASAEAGFVKYSRSLSRRYALATVADGTQDRPIVEQIRQLHRFDRFDVVLPGDLESTVLLARIKDQIDIPSFPTPPASVVVRLADKARFAELCCEHSLPIPKTIPLQSKSNIDIDHLIAELGLPLVLKPTMEQGGAGVVVADSSRTIQARVIENKDYAFSPLIAQEFIPGLDMGISFVARDGEILCIGAQIRRSDRVEFTECPSLELAAERLVSLLNYSGAANLDVRFDPASGRAAFVECNPRFWLTMSNALWCGTNFVEIGLRHRNPEGTRLRVEPGRFSMRPLRFCANFLCLKLDRRAFTRAQLMGVWRALTDPLPVLSRALHAIGQRIRRWRARSAPQRGARDGAVSDV